MHSPLLSAALLAPLLALAGAAAASGGPQATVSACRYGPIAITSTAPRRFVGRAGALEVRLTSERDGTDIESFPDSALAIRRADGRGCEAEGGVWQRSGVYVADDGRTVAAIESSGSNDLLVFFDSASCRRVGEIDVSNTRWQFRGAEIVATPAGAARPTRVVRLDASCRPPARK